VQVPPGHKPNGIDMIHDTRCKSQKRRHNTKIDSGHPIILMILIDSEWIWICDQFQWKSYLLTFPRSRRTPQLDVVYDLSVSFNVTAPRWVGLWILNLFWQFCSDPILIGPKTSTIGTFISSSFRAYIEHPNPISYTSCTSIWSRGGLILWVGLEVKLWNSELDWISTLIFGYWVDLRSCRTWREGIPHPWKALWNHDMIFRFINLQKYRLNQNTRHNVNLVFSVARISPQ
jgi:hypothetical protein